MVKLSKPVLSGLILSATTIGTSPGPGAPDTDPSKKTVAQPNRPANNPGHDMAAQAAAGAKQFYAQSHTQPAHTQRSDGTGMSPNDTLIYYAQCMVGISVACSVLALFRIHALGKNQDAMSRKFEVLTAQCKDLEKKNSDLTDMVAKQKEVLKISNEAQLKSSVAAVQSAGDKQYSTLKKEMADGIAKWTKTMEDFILEVRQGSRSIRGKVEACDQLLQVAHTASKSNAKKVTALSVNCTVSEASQKKEVNDKIEKIVAGIKKLHEATRVNLQAREADIGELRLNVAKKNDQDCEKLEALTNLLNGLAVRQPTVTVQSLDSSVKEDVQELKVETQRLRGLLFNHSAARITNCDTALDNQWSRIEDCEASCRATRNLIGEVQKHLDALSHIQESDQQQYSSNLQWHLTVYNDLLRRCQELELQVALGIEDISRGRSLRRVSSGLHTSRSRSPRNASASKPRSTQSGSGSSASLTDIRTGIAASPSQNSREERGQAPSPHPLLRLRRMSSTTSLRSTGSRSSSKARSSVE